MPDQPSNETVKKAKTLLISVGVIIVFALIMVFTQDFSSQKAVDLSKPSKRYTWDGDEIQENGLTQEQEIKIRLHCAEKPQAWDCR